MRGGQRRSTSPVLGNYRPDEAAHEPPSCIQLLRQRRVDSLPTASERADRLMVVMKRCTKEAVRPREGPSKRRDISDAADADQIEASGARRRDAAARRFRAAGRLPAIASSTASPRIDSAAVGTNTTPATTTPATTTLATTTPATAAAIVSIVVPDRESLLRRADYVSADGNRVRIGDVEISTTGAISRSGPAER